MTDPRLETVAPDGLDAFAAREGLALVELWARWSGLSYLVRSAVERVLVRRPELVIRVARVDVSDAPELLTRLGLLAPPALLLFVEGEVVDLHAGLITADALEDWIQTAGLGSQSHGTLNPRSED